MKTKKRFLGILLSLVMVLGLVPGMSLTAYAATGYSPYSINCTHGRGNRPSVLNPGDHIDGDGWDYITIHVADQLA